MKPGNILMLILCIALPLLVGGIAGYATSSNISNWYTYLTKPSFNPPNYLFGPVWTTLYILMGISLFLIWKSPEGKNRSNSLTLFFIQLLLNFAWSFIFFQFHQVGAAFIEIILLWVSILLMIRAFYGTVTLAAYLQIPYLLWVTFATLLNGSILYLN
jgi:tryptophan-rich sensory protein